MREFPYAIRKRNDAHYRAFRPALTETAQFAFVSFDVMAVDSG